MQIPNTFLVANHVLAHDDKSFLSADQQSPSSYHTENKRACFLNSEKSGNVRTTTGDMTELDALEL